MLPRPTWVCLFGLLTAVSPAAAQSISLAETVKEGDCFHIRLAMDLTGEMQIERDGKTVPIKMAARAEHDLSQRVLIAGDRGGVEKAASLYSVAKAAISIGSEKSARTLRPKRTLLVAQRHKDQALTYCPAGPLTREELELVGEHFDTLAVVGLLPGTAVSTGGTWKITNATAQALCNFDGLTEQSLTGKLDQIDGNTAVFSIRGAATGIEQGAQVKLTIDATGRFDTKAGRLVAVEWKQDDDRGQGPANPATKVKTITTLSRRPIETPESLGDVALVSVPDGFEPPARMTNLVFSDPKGRFDLSFPREWQMVSQTTDHLVLRLMERGDFVAQVTVTPWTAADKAKHLAPDDFKEAMNQTPGWEPEMELEAGEVPAEDGYWIYRVSTQGTMDGESVVQNFFLVAGPEGDQAVLAFTMTPKQADRLGSRDLALAASLAFPKK